MPDPGAVIDVCIGRGTSLAFAVARRALNSRAGNEARVRPTVLTYSYGEIRIADLPAVPEFESVRLEGGCGTLSSLRRGP